jgi:hypothetical protein
MRLRISAIEISVADRQLVLPVTQSSGTIWMLDHVDR